MRIKEFKELGPPHKGLSELRIDLQIQSGKRQYKRHIRVAGLWLPEDHEFILLLGSEKSGRIYCPNNAFNIAEDLKRDFEHGRGSLIERI